MTTTTVKTIGSGGDYTTLQAWEDAAPADLVVADVVWQGQILAGNNFSAAGNVLTIAGSTSDATRYKHLTTAAGASFQDHATASTNPLFPDSTKGATVTTTGTYNTGGAIFLNEAYAVTSKLQVMASGTGNGANTAVNTAVNTLIDQCLISSFVTNFSAGTLSMSGGKVRNTLVVCRAASASQIIYSSSGGAVAFENVTALVVSGLAVASRAYSGSYNTQTFNNCAFYGVALPRYTGSGSGSYTGTNNYTDGTAATGFTNSTLAAASFANTTNNFRITSGSALQNAGLTLTSAFDAMGTARPQGASWDIGAHELVSGGGSSFLAGKPTVLSQAIGGMY